MLDRDTCYVTTIGLSQIAGAQLLKIYNPRNWINAAQAGPIGWSRRGEYPTGSLDLVT